jgi:hypothetical protein
VQPDGLGQFKNPPHRDLNPRPSGLQHSTLTTTLFNKAKCDNSIVCLLIVNLDIKSVLTLNKLTLFIAYSSGNELHLFSVVPQLISQSPLKRTNFTSRTLGTGVSVNDRLSLKQKQNKKKKKKVNIKFNLISLIIFVILIIWFVRLLALRPLLAYCASLG